MASNTLDTFGKMQTKKLVVQSEVDFQTSDDYKVTLKSANQTANRILTIPALVGNSFVLSSESNLNPANLTINSLVAEASPADADEMIIRDASAGGANKKVALSAIKSYVGSVPSGTNGQVIVYDGSNDAQAVAMSGDASIVASGALTIANGAIDNAKVDASAAIAMSKLDLAITNSEVANGAAIAQDKLNLSIADAQVSATAAIAQSKLNLSITNAEVNASAAIATSKLAINSKVPASAGTVEASKFIEVDGNKDFTSVRNITGTGAFQAAEINIGASGWRFRLNSGNLELQYYDSGTSAFVTKQVFTAS